MFLGVDILDENRERAQLAEMIWITGRAAHSGYDGEMNFDVESFSGLPVIGGGDVCGPDGCGPAEGAGTPGSTGTAESTGDADFAHPAVELSDGTSIPQLGFGTWRLTERDDDALAAALETGYRHIDTATVYKNEEMVGRVLGSSGLDGVYITTKIHPTDEREPAEVMAASLEALQVERVNMWLLHNTSDRNVDIWRAMIEEQEKGHTASIGVSNLSIAEIDELIDATGVAPVMNQFRLGLSLHDPEFVAALRERGIAPEGYSPLRATNLDDPHIIDVAQNLDVDPADVVIAWHMAKGYIVIPKSATASRIRSNAYASRLTLSEQHIAQLDRMERTA